MCYEDAVKFYLSQSLEHTVELGSSIPCGHVGSSYTIKHKDFIDVKGHFHHENAFKEQKNPLWNPGVR